MTFHMIVRTVYSDLTHTDLISENLAIAGYSPSQQPADLRLYTFLPTDFQITEANSTDNFRAVQYHGLLDTDHQHFS